MSNDTKLNIAVIGCGQWGKNIARNLAELGALRIICDTDELRGRALALELGAEFILNLSDVLARTDIIGVAIATPAVTHAHVASLALDSEKHVFVEKPIAMSAVDARMIANKAHAKRLVLMTGHLLQYHPMFVKLLALLRSGELGRVQYIYSNRLNQGRVRTEENALWSLAPHDISMILAVAGGAPSRVTAMGQAAVQRHICDIAVVGFEFDSGLKAHLFCSWLNPYKEHLFAVVGDKAMLVFDDTAESWEDKLVLYAHKVTWNGVGPEFIKGTGARVLVAKGEPLRNEMDHFLECVASGIPSRTGPDEAIAVLRVLAAAQQSMDTLEPVRLECEEV